jgi:hypothetical protein
MTAAPDGNGYWFVASDGGVFSYGSALFQGSLGGQRLSSPVAGMAATKSGRGYWITTSGVATPPTCQPFQLGLVYDPAHSGGGAAGSFGLTYRFTNLASISCTMIGYPGLQMLDVHGHALPTHVTHSTTLGSPTTVTIPPGGQAWFAIQFPTRTGFGTISCPTSSALAVVPPNTTTAFVLLGPGGQLQPFGGTTQNVHCGEITTSPILGHPPF